MPENIKKYKKLVKRCIRSETKAQQELYGLFAPKMLSICRRYARHKNEADDIFQSAWLKIFENINQLKNYELLEWWMRKIFVNEALLFYKRTERVDFDSDSFIMATQKDKGITVYLKMEHDEVTRLIQNLPDKMRMVFNLFIIEGYSHKEISQMMKISEGTSKSQLHDARKILQKQINELNDVNFFKKNCL